MIFSFENPNANKIVVIGNFFSIYSKIQNIFGSNSKSNHDPLPGMILQLNKAYRLRGLPLSWSKNTPGLLCI